MSGPAWLDAPVGTPTHDPTFDPTKDPRLVEPTPVTDADRAIATLAGHDGWEALTAAILDHEDAWAKQVAAQVIRGTVDLDPIKVARARGYFSAAKNILGRVDAAKAAVDAEEAA